MTFLPKLKLLSIGLFALTAMAQQHRPVSPHNVRRLDNLLTEIVGPGPRIGVTADGAVCTVTYREREFLFDGKPSGDTYKELMITAPASVRGLCGPSGTLFLIARDDFAGRGNIYDMYFESRARFGAFQSYNVNAAELRGEKVQGTQLNVLFDSQRGPLAVELKGARSCHCRFH